MTVLNFPSTAGKPTDGSFLYIANGVVYSWDGEKWVSNTQANGGGGGRSEPVHFDGPDAPDFDSLIAGDQWYNTNDGRLYTYTLNDNNDLVWVDASPDSQVPQFWERTGTTLEPTNDGDDVDLGTGDLSAAAGTFSGDVFAYGDPNNGTDRAARLRQGVVIACNSPANNNIFEGYLQGNNLPNFQVAADGTTKVGPSNSPSITLDPNGTTYFAGTKFQMAANGYFSADRRGDGSYGAARMNSANKGLEVVSSGGTAVWSVDYSGTATARNIIFELEPESPANITSTMVEGEEQQVYSGPTLDVKEKLLEFVARIEELEAKVQQLEGGNN